MDEEIVDTPTGETEAPVVESTPTEQTEEVPSKEPMIPKSRFDEAVQKARDEGRNQKPKVENKNIDEIIDQKLAPLKVQIETEAVLRKYSDFDQFASGALNQIKRNPSLSLEDAYKLTKYESLQSKAKEEGKKEAYQTIEQKEALQVERSGPKQPARPLDDLVKDKTVPLQEIAKLLPRS